VASTASASSPAAPANNNRGTGTCMHDVNTAVSVLSQTHVQPGGQGGTRAAAARVVGPAAVLPLGLRGPLRFSCTSHMGGQPAEGCQG
jgi:hypothetical protein